VINQYLPQYFGTSPQFWFGIVEDRADPIQLGRVRVRVYGYHTPDTTLIPKENLPWAQVLMPVTSAAMSGVGTTPTGLMEGSTVFGMWLDGNDQQVPFVLGSINVVDGANPNGIISNTTNTINDSTLGTPGEFHPTGDGPAWLQAARGETGVKEIKGSQHNPKILEYLKVVGQGNGDETSWCSAFVAWSLQKSGQSISGITGFAKSHLTAGCYRKLDKLAYGAVIVFNRGTDPTYGHVGFCCGVQGGRVQILGGNQSDQVKVSGFSTTNIAGIMWPTGGGEPVTATS
jgi:uncharacterized protein (TIGR02594 family)